VCWGEFEFVECDAYVVELVVVYVCCYGEGVVVYP